MKSIFFIIPTLTQGGAERVIITLIKYLDRSKFNITIMVVNMKEEVYKNEISHDVRIIDLKCHRVLTAIPKIIYNLWRYKPQVVLSTLGHLNIAIAFSRFFMPSGIKFIARETIVVTEKLKRLKNPKFWRFLHRFYYPTFDKIICQSEDMLKDLACILGTDKNLVLINNPVDHKRIQKLIKQNNPAVEKFYEDESFIYFVAAGRFIDQKGFELLIETIALLKNSQIRLAILGYGPLEKKLLSLIDCYGLREQVILPGYQKNPYVWIAKAHAFVLSSFYEGFPNVVLEALSCGTPVISTPAPGGTKEILESIDGCYLSEEISAESLAKAFYNYMNTNNKNIQEGVIRKYNPENICREYTKIFLN